MELFSPWNIIPLLCARLKSRRSDSLKQCAAKSFEHERFADGRAENDHLN